MQTRTICCKLSTTQPVKDALKETSLQFVKACNYILKRALEEKTSNAIKLHKLCYKEVRERFGLSANLAVRSIRRVSACCTRLKGRRKAPKRFKAQSIDYDARIFHYHSVHQAVSLRTLNKRIQVPLILGEYQRRMLAQKSPTSATVIYKNGHWYIHMVVECEETPCVGTKILGVDLGITNIAATSTGLLIQGASRKQLKSKYAKVRASLQSKATAGAKKVLKRISGRESRRIRKENHELSKELINDAKRHNCGIIRMEQLKGIRDRTKTWNKHLNRMVASWSFYQLQQFVKYKASSAGLTFEWVDPQYTSQTCHQCLQLGSRVGEQFNCLTCGESHADINAACVISLGGAACKPARISNVVS